MLFLENPLWGGTGTKSWLEVSVSNNKCAQGDAERCLLLSWDLPLLKDLLPLVTNLLMGVQELREGFLERIRGGGSCCRAGMRAQ